MTKTTSLVCLTATLLYLIIGHAVAEDKPETQQPKPDAANYQADESKPKKETSSKDSSQSSASNEEPDCD